MSTETQQLNDSLNISSVPPMLSCPPLPPQLTPFDTGPAINAMGKALNVTTCSTNRKKTDTSKSVSSWFSSSNTNVKTDDQSTIGCEPLSIMSQTYQNAQNNISCILSNAKSTMNLNTVAINSIIINGSALNCGIININQRNSISVKSSITLSDTDKINITNQVKNVANATAGFVSNIIKSTPQIPDSTGPLGAGGKAASNIQELISATDYNKTVNNAITQMDIGTQVGNNLVFNNATLNASVCNIDQYIQVNIIASSVLISSLSVNGTNLFDTAAATIDVIKKNAVPNSTPPPPPPQPPTPAKSSLYLYLFITFVFLLIIIIFSIIFFRHSNPLSIPLSKSLPKSLTTPISKPISSHFRPHCRSH